MMLVGLLLGMFAAFGQDRGARGDDAGFEGGAEDYVPAPKRRLYYTNATFLRANPLGLINIFRLGVRRRLSTSDSILLQDTYTYGGLTALLTPAYGRIGAYGEAQLLSVFRVFAQVEGISYFSTFDQVLSYPAGQAAQYTDQEIADEGDLGLNFGTSGWVAVAGFTVRAAAGPIALRTTGQTQIYNIGLEGDDVSFYDQYWDRLAPNGGFMWLQDTDLLLLAGKARIGARYTFTANLTKLDIGDEGNLAHHRVGPLFAYQFSDKGAGSRFNQPTLFVIAQWWAQHPYRTGQFERNGQTVGIPRGLPLIAAGLAFNGDFATSKRPQAPPAK
ncbi:MAG: hypothetical protein AAGA48_07615 [Myxococcota bacterium]